MAGGVVPNTGAGAAAAAESAKAIKASGAIVKVEPQTFQSILDRLVDPLIVIAETGFFSTWYQYLTSYKGLILFTKTKEELLLPAECEIIESKKIWTPD